MAEVIKEWSFDYWEVRASDVYPWKQWADGQIWLLKRGEDYKTWKHIYTSARNHAKRIKRVLQLSRVDQGDKAVLRFLP